MNEPRILTLTGTAHPKALVQAIDPANGILMFAWLDADGNRVDSGNSGAKFPPVAPLPPENPGDAPTYPEVEDATLITAIENPPVEASPVPAEVTRRQLLLILHRSGVSRGAIKQTIGNDEEALIEYEEALSFRRDHPLVSSLGQALSMTEENIDNLFRQASQL
jgi:hypothetical protein